MSLDQGGKNEETPILGMGGSVLLCYGYDDRIRTKVSNYLSI
jgi:hypothetical protein